VEIEIENFKFIKLVIILYN